MPIRTEIFDDFTTNETALDKGDTKSVDATEVSSAPPLYFLNELKEKLKERAIKLDEVDDVAFKSFDVKTQKFVTISK